MRNMGGLAQRNPLHIDEYFDYEIVGLEIGTCEPIRVPIRFHGKAWLEDCKRMGVVPRIDGNHIFFHCEPNQFR